MGREARRVPARWKHPKKQGEYVPMHQEFPYTKEEVQEGLRAGWLSGRPPYYGVRVMPRWTPKQRTHFQMYENTSEGTPISPVMASEEDLARWLSDNRSNAFAGQTATFDQWLSTIRRGSAPSMVIDENGIKSGVAASR